MLQAQTIKTKHGVHGGFEAVTVGFPSGLRGAAPPIICKKKKKKGEEEKKKEGKREEEEKR